MPDQKPVHPSLIIGEEVLRLEPFDWPNITSATVKSVRVHKGARLHGFSFLFNLQVEEVETIVSTTEDGIVKEVLVSLNQTVRIGDPLIRYIKLRPLKEKEESILTPLTKEEKKQIVAPPEVMQKLKKLRPDPYELAKLIDYTDWIVAEMYEGHKTTRATIQAVFRNLRYYDTDVAIACGLGDPANPIDPEAPRNKVAEQQQATGCLGSVLFLALVAFLGYLGDAQ